jgi:hypothetical protein
MSKSILCFALSVFLAFGAWAKNNDLIEPPKVDLVNSFDVTNASRATVMYINHLNYVVAKLGRMNNLFVLQQEYENLTDNNFNLATIKDEEIVRLIVELQEALAGLQKSNVKILRAQSKFEAEKKAAIWKALPQPTMLIAAPHPAVIAIVVAGAVLTSVQNYMSARHDANEKLKDTHYDSGSEMFAHINEINKELFLAQWRLMQRYQISDSSRVTRNDAEIFLGFTKVLEVMDGQREKLVHEIFKNHESELKYLPFYWITRAAAAKNLDDDKDLKYSCEGYFNLYRTAPIIRKDTDACAMALSYVSVVIKGKKNINEVNKEWVRRWLDFVEKTARIPEWQIKYSVAMLYRLIGDDEKAKQVLHSALLEVYACIRVWEQSHKKQNIFRSTPALEKAFDKLAEKEEQVKKDLPDWEKESEELIPYDGYVWLSGALYHLGETGIYNHMSIDNEKIGLSKHYITGKYKKYLPEFRKEGSMNYRLRNIGFGKEEYKVKVFQVDNTDQTAYEEKIPVNGVYRLHDRGEIYIFVQTGHGITAKYTFKDGVYNQPSLVEVFYPWSIKPESYKVN